MEKFATSRIAVDPNDEWAHNDLFISQILLGKLAEAEETLDYLELFSELGHSHAITLLTATLRKIETLTGLDNDILHFTKEALSKLESV